MPEEHHPTSSSGLRFFCVVIFLILLLLTPEVAAFSFQNLHKLRTTQTSLMGIKGFRSWLETKFPDCVVDMPKSTASDKFDHVLIDMNQILHVVLRRSRSDGHGLTLLMQELDECLRIATPTKSLVLAIDGPPSAAKLAVQRKRRFGTVVKAEFKSKQIDRLLQSSSTRQAKSLNRKKRRAGTDLRTLCITPGTDFMRSAEQALLYWVWQRLSSRKSCLAENNVKVFISPSAVPGEGEVKLLEWCYSKTCRKGETIAIMGGDSDLVLEGLVIPPSSTHNVFVLLPEGNKRYLCVSLWEISRSLHKRLPYLDMRGLIKARNDLALLLILNGNDYLPKLRGSSGFNRLFHAYLWLHKKWHERGKQEEAYLVHPDSLEFNLSFCIEFFGYLSSNVSPGLLVTGTAKTERITPLSQLNNFVEAGYLPSPVSFRILRDDGDNDNSQLQQTGTLDGDLSVSTDDSDEDYEESTGPHVLVQLSLGDPDSEEYCVFEVWHPVARTNQKAKQELATMALNDLMGTDSIDYDTDDSDEQLPGVHSGYDWEVHESVEAKCDEYLYGLLWNLQTYQDGVCPDYGFNYGKRLSPTAAEIVAFMKQFKKKRGKLGLLDLSPGDFVAPLSAGVSCLAALPSPVKHLVPEPYRSLDNELVESIYACCMDKKTNAFDIATFERMISNSTAKQFPRNNLSHGGGLDIMDEPNVDQGRRILLGDHYWTVISKVPTPLPHPFAPPSPVSERWSKLRADSRIRVSRFIALSRPRPRSVWSKELQDGGEPEHTRRTNVEEEVSHSDPGFLGRKGPIESILYKTAFSKLKRNGKKKSTPKQQGGKSKSPQAPKNGEIPLTTSDHVTALACLKQLEDSGVIGKIHWKEEKKTANKSADPIVETITLSVSGAGSAVKTPRKSYAASRRRSSGKQNQRHKLASRALGDILGEECEWVEMSYQEIKELLLSRDGE